MTFYGSNLSALGISPSLPPLLTYYRYIGRLGIPGNGGNTSGEALGLPISDDNILLQSSTNPIATAQLIVNGPPGNSVYKLPSVAGMNATILTDETLNSTMYALGVVDGGEA